MSSALYTKHPPVTNSLQLHGKSLTPPDGDVRIGDARLRARSGESKLCAECGYSLGLSWPGSASNNRLTNSCSVAISSRANSKNLSDISPGFGKESTSGSFGISGNFGAIFATLSDHALTTFS